jgi:BlaI family penicillinase repressor
MPRFTPGELAVMRILWKHGELKPAEIQTEFPRQIKNPALRSYLAILVEKGHVTRQRRGKAYYYQAKTPRESTFRTMLRELVDSCCEGSTEALLSRLIQMEKLSDRELIELRRVADGDAAEPASRQGESE